MWRLTGNWRERRWLNWKYWMKCLYHVFYANHCASVIWLTEVTTHTSDISDHISSPYHPIKQVEQSDEFININLPTFELYFHQGSNANGGDKTDSTTLVRLWPLRATITNYCRWWLQSNRASSYESHRCHETPQRPQLYRTFHDLQVYCMIEISFNC